MKILLISPYAPLKDGIADYAVRLAHSYRNAGHDTAVLGTSPRSRPGTMGTVGLRPTRLVATLRAVRQFRPDAVHLQHSVASYGALLPAVWLLVLIVRVLGVPVLVTQHEVTRDLARLRFAGVIYYRATLHAADVVHVHTAAARDVFTDRLGLCSADVIVVPHPVFPLPGGAADPAALAARHGVTGRRLLLLFGYVHVEKGLHELLEGLAALLQRRPDLRAGVLLVVAGDVRPRKGLFQRFERKDQAYLDAAAVRAQAPDLRGSVLFVGHVPESEVRAWFSLSDVVLLPYTHTEQSGVANLAVAAGRPVIATSVGGLGELFKHIGDQFPGLTPEEIASTLRRHLDRDPHEAARQADRGYVALRAAGDPDRAAAVFTHALSERQRRSR